MQIRYDMIVCYVLRPDPSRQSHELLQLRRDAGDFMGGTWQTVSGKIEPGEKAWEAALRELREETALVPREFYQLDHVETFYIASQDTLWHRPGFCALVDRDAEVVLNDEHDAHRWVARAAIDQHVMWPGERVALAEAAREILDNGPAKPYLKIPLPA